MAELTNCTNFTKHTNCTNFIKHNNCTNFTKHTNPSVSSNLNDNTTYQTENTLAHNTSKTQTYPNAINMRVKARLHSVSYALFSNVFHANGKDNFHIYLKKLETKLKNQIIDGIFKSSFDPMGFNFKAPKVKCFTKNKKQCIIENLLDKDVSCKVKIYPYDFLDANGKQLIGISIHMIEIYESEYQAKSQKMLVPELTEVEKIVPQKKEKYASILNGKS